MNTPHHPALLCLIGISTFLLGLLLASCDEPARVADRHCNPNGTCTACKTCANCGHCARRGGTCSVCRPAKTLTKAKP